MNNLMRIFDNFPTLFTDDLFGDFDRAFKHLDWFDPETSFVSLRKGFPKGDAFVNKAGELVMELALAGYSKDDLSVEVDGDSLLVSGKKIADENENSRVLTRRAFSQKYYVNYSNQWDLENSFVSYKDGILKVVVKPLVTKPQEIRKIEIK